MKYLIAIYLIIIFGNISFSQDVPRVISYQGVLVDANGKPVNSDNLLVNFAFYDAENGGNKLGNIKPRSLKVQGGLFFTLLGSESEDILPAFDRPTWLEIETNGTKNRVLMTAAVYALNIPDGIVTPKKIKSESIELHHLKQGNNVGEILKWDGTNWIREIDNSLKRVTAIQPIEGSGTESDPLRITLPESLPIGSILAYWGNNPPEGWLLCDGSDIPDTYSKLRVFLKSTSTPDLRGMFLRGANTTINKPSKGPDGDPDELKRIGGLGVSKVGSFQMDAFQDHLHTYRGIFTGVAAGGGHALGFSGSTSATDFTSDSRTISTNPNQRFSTETRPKNVYVNFIIKAR